MPAAQLVSSEWFNINEPESVPSCMHMLGRSGILVLMSIVRTSTWTGHTPEMPQIMTKLSLSSFASFILQWRTLNVLMTASSTWIFVLHAEACVEILAEFAIPYASLASLALHLILSELSYEDFDIALAHIVLLAFLKSRTDTSR